VVRYHAGEEYKPHFDFGGECDFLENLHIGRRHVTMLIYLNDVEAPAPPERGVEDNAALGIAEEGEGRAAGAVAPRAQGETSFPALSLKVTPRAGTALVFNDCLDGGSPDRRTLHGGEPPAPGAYKYAINVWIRANSFHSTGREKPRSASARVDAVLAHDDEADAADYAAHDAGVAHAEQGSWDGAGARGSVEGVELRSQHGDVQSKSDSESATASDAPQPQRREWWRLWQ
jgi:hypothetical protein